MSYGMTAVQSEVLVYIKRFIEENGFSPSYDEISHGLGLRSKSGVHRAVHALAERGKIRMIPNKQRTIEVP